MIDAHSSCGATGPGGGATNGWFPTTPPGVGEKQARRKPRRASSITIPRPLPWDTPLSRAWPGTLIASWTALTTCVILTPRWPTLAIVAGLLTLASAIIRLPRGVIPRPPTWLISGFIGGCVGAWLGDGLEVFLRATTLALIILWGSALVAWVTPTAALANALSFFLTPLRALGVPVDQWSLVIASALRSLPMLRDQTQAVLDTAKLRLGQKGATASLGGYARLGVDVITAILSATSRGAAETGRAMSMRGALQAATNTRPARENATKRVALKLPDACVIAATLLGVAGVVATRVVF